MEQHRANPTCNACHGIMDPLGFALENFDTIAGWRDKDKFAGTRIDASGKLVDGTPVTGPDDLRNALMKRSDQFVQTMTEKMMIYALGRTLEPYDMPTIRKIVRDAAPGKYKFSSIVMGIAASAPFQQSEVPQPQPPATQVAQTTRFCMFITKKYIPRRKFFARRRRDHGAAPARRYDPGADGSGADSGQSYTSSRVHLFPSRRHHE